MTTTELKAQFPDAYAAIAEEGSKAGFLAGYQTGAKDWCGIGQLAGTTDGATAEQKRIADVQAQTLPGHEALIAGFIADGKTTGAEAATKIIAAVRVQNASNLAAFNADGTPVIPGAQTDAGTGEGAKEKKGFEALVKDHMEANKCGKGDAIQAIARANPVEHAAYIQAMNKGGA